MYTIKILIRIVQFIMILTDSIFVIVIFVKLLSIAINGYTALARVGFLLGPCFLESDDII